MKRTTLEHARAQWEADPCGSTAAEYRRVARTYNADGMIEDDTLELILAETAAYMIGAGRGTPLTADTITDEEIEALRAPASEEGEGIATEHEYLGPAEVLNLCDEALGDFEYGERLADMSPEWFAMRKRDARSRCAEILNERATLADGGGS